MSLKLVIWDMDGTIVDSRKVIQGAMVSAFEAMKLNPPEYEQTRQIVGLGLDEACRRLAPSDFPPEQLADLVSAYRDAFIANRRDPNFREPLYHGVLDVLDDLRSRGTLMAIATGKSKRGVETIFGMHDLAQYFDTVWCADDGPGKPHPFMVEQSMSALGCEPQDSVVVGDAIFDMQMSRSANVVPHGVSWGFGESDELLAAGAHVVHETMGNLKRALVNFVDEGAGKIP